jgi:hypothetical protein
MSTEHQQYSAENQLEVVRQYAASHNMEIVQEYSDHGRSGLNIAGREGLNKLMSDVESKRTDFSAMLGAPSDCFSANGQIYRRIHPARRLPNRLNFLPTATRQLPEPPWKCSDLLCVSKTFLYSA